MFLKKINFINELRGFSSRSVTREIAMDFQTAID